MNWIVNLLLFWTAFACMEAFAWSAHKYVMHGWGWGWHKSHHQPREGLFEKNDLYVLVFSSVVIGLFALGVAYWRPLMSVASGITFYGVVYSLFHDGLVHKRWPLPWQPRSGYFKRLVQAHRLHHATRSREGAVAFGFLWAGNPEKLKREFQAARRQERIQ